VLDPFQLVSEGSAWAYVIIAVVIAGSAVFPPLPSETMIFTPGAAAGAGALQIPPVILAGAVGSLLGDVIGYGLGRVLGERALRRFARGERGRRSLGWARARSGAAVAR